MFFLIVILIKHWVLIGFMKGKGDIILNLSDVWKIYQMGKVKVEALRGVDLKVRRGEFLIIEGPSGSGKSTLMNMVGCLDIPSKGTIRLDGQDISKLSESELAKIRGKTIGFIFQKFNLLSNLSALENVALPMSFQSVDENKRIMRSRKLLDIVGLNKRYNHKPNELSGGQQQRVAIARSLSNDPDIILGDEPTGNLDTKTSQSILKLLSDLHKNEKKTIILVTHDPTVKKYADRVVRIVDGKLSESVIGKN